VPVEKKEVQEAKPEATDTAAFKVPSVQGTDTTSTKTAKAKELGSRLLIKGMKGPDVLQMEKLLVTKGYKLTPNDYFDEYAEIVVKDFQTKIGIPADGKVGPLTIYYLKSTNTK
jgi:murein L,D-transpeptidase YcbB/YkuD